MSNQVPERLINYRAYKDGNALLGTVDVEMPSLEALTDTISGAGIAGELDTPTMGHFGSMGITINWRTITQQAMSLAGQQWHALEFRGAQQNHDAATGQLVVQAVRVAVRAMPKNLSLGTFAPSAATDTSTEFEVSYLLVELDGTTVLELDKLNFKYRVGGGDDVLSAVRAALGM